MNDNVDAMVDGFVEGVQSVDANLDFTLTKDQLSKIKNTFKPLQFEENICLEFHSDGYIQASSVDNGVTLWTEISTVEMDLKGEQYSMFYIDLKRINKLSDVCDSQIAFSVCDGELKSKIGSTDIKISLPLYELTTNLSFEEEEKEVKTSEDVASLASRLAAAKGSGSFLLSSLSMSDLWIYGTSENVSIVKGGFDKMIARVTPDFLSYLANISFTNEDIQFVKGKDSDGTPVLTLVSDNVYYKVSLMDVEPEDIQTLMDETTLGDFSFDSLDPIRNLAILAIPLLGQENAAFKMKGTAGGEYIEITVTDESGRMSSDKWACTPIGGDFEADLNISSFLNTLNAISKEGVSLLAKDTCLLLSDEISTNLLIKYV